MPIFRGTNSIAKIFRGNTEITKAFRGTNLIFQSGGPQYQLIANVNVTSNTTQIDFTGLNITKTDELRLVYTFVGDSTTNSINSLRVNDITSNYIRQEFILDGNTRSAVKNSTDVLSVSRSTNKVSGFADIKISNNDRFHFISRYVDRIGSESTQIRQFNIIAYNTSTVTSITKLSVVCNRTNGIAVGSRLQLYKVVQ